MLEKAHRLKPDDRHAERLDELRARSRIHDPATILPEEIWREIMLAGRDDPQFGLRCASVSRTWRQKTLACRVAWHTLVLNGKRPVEKAKIWIKRSGGQLQSLKVSAASASTAFSKSTCSQLSDLLLPAIPRLITLIVSVASSETFSLLVASWRHKAKSLQEIRFNIRQEISEHLTRLDAELLSASADSLRSLEYSGPPPWWPADLTTFSPAQVSRLETVIVRSHRTEYAPLAAQRIANNSKAIRYLLRDARNLRHLEIDHHFNLTMPSDAASERIELPKLVSFSEKAEGVITRGECPSWLSSLGTPSLTALAIKHQYECVTPERLGALCSASQIDLAKITNITLRPTSMSGESARPLLRACLSLEDIALHGDYDDTLLDAIRETVQLKRVVLQSPRITPSAIMRLVAASKFKTLVVVHPHNWDKRAEDWLKRNVPDFRVEFVGAAARDSGWRSAMQRLGY